LTLIFALLTFIAAAETSVDSHLNTEPLKVISAVTQRDNIQPGARMPVTLKITLADGFSAYEDKLKALPISPGGMDADDIQIKPLVDFMDFAGTKHKGVQKEATLTFFIEMPKAFTEEFSELVFDLQYVACTQKICLPFKKVDVRIPVDPVKPGFSLNMPPAQEMKALMGQNNFNFNLLSVWGFLFIFGVGFLTSLTPCVYPLIPITLSVIGARSEKKATAFLISLVYVLGMSFTYAILGVIAAQTGGLFGQWLSHPAVILAFALIFFLMALSLFGLFEIRAPHFVTQKLTQNKSSKGLMGTFIAGLIPGVIASPCVGPVLVSILAFISQSKNLWAGFFMLFTFGMGIGLLFLILGTFSSLLKKLPRSGKWMDRIKIFMGLVMLFMSFWYVKPLLERASSHTQVEAAKFKNGWLPYSEERIAQAKADGRPVIIDFFADWCGACVELDDKTFSQTEFIEESKKFVLLKVDATETFPGLDELQKRYDVFGLPTIAFINAKGELQKDLSLAGFEEIKPFMERMKKAEK